MDGIMTLSIKKVLPYALLRLSKALLLIEPRGTFEHRRALVVGN